MTHIAIAGASHYVADVTAFVTGSDKYEITTSVAALVYDEQC